jgi:hypothetical protein
MAEEIDRHCIKIAALGRRFQLGDLYNYHRNDCIAAGKYLLRFHFAVIFLP